MVTTKLRLVLVAVMLVSSSMATSGSEPLPEKSPGLAHPPSQSGTFPGFSSRKRRNVAQLAHLVDNYTPYRSSQLLNHGNWCGYGGDRAHDGSFRDQCDGCCKTHDFCYEELLSHISEGFGPNEILSNLQVLGGPLRVDHQHEKLFANIGLPSKRRRCVPYVDLYRYEALPGGHAPRCSEVGGICSRAACDCDMEFVNCLRRTSCQMHG